MRQCRTLLGTLCSMHLSVVILRLSNMISSMNQSQRLSNMTSPRNQSQMLSLGNMTSPRNRSQMLGNMTSLSNMTSPPPDAKVTSPPRQRGGQQQAPSHIQHGWRKSVQGQRHTSRRRTTRVVLLRHRWSFRLKFFVCAVAVVSQASIVFSYVARIAARTNSGAEYALNTEAHPEFAAERSHRT